MTDREGGNTELSRANVHKDIVKRGQYGTIIWMRYSIFVLLFVCSLGFSATTHAQVPSTLTAQIDVNMVPENPGPNQMVNVSLVSYSTDINTASITWRVNGGTQKSGVGQKTFSFTTGNTNTTTTLGITIVTKEGETVTKTFSIKPAGVDLIWQTDGFVPPFYKGKTLFSYQNRITFIALPHMTSGNGAEISAKNLIYKWTKDGTVINTASGLGNSTYTFVGSLISRPLDIEVEVTSPNQNGVGTAEVVVSPVDPSVVFYKKNPLYGIEFQKALTGTVGLTDSKELAVFGAPFFFGTLSANAPELLYKWSVNGSSIDSDTSQTTRVFRQLEGTSGTSNISLQIENSRKILQLANGNFNLMFGN